MTVGTKQVGNEYFGQVILEKVSEDLIMAVAGVNIDTSTPIADQIQLETAEVFVRGEDVPLTNGVWIKFLSTGFGYVTNFGTVDPINHCFVYDGSPNVFPFQVSNLNELIFAASQENAKFCWLKG